MNKIILGILLSVTLLAACKKSGPAEYRIDDNLKAHFNYQVGSYWVYKDSLTGEEDSFYVSNNFFGSSQVTNDEISDGIDITIIQKTIYPQGKLDSTLWTMQLNGSYISISWANTKSKNIVGGDIMYPSISYPIHTGTVGGYNNAVAFIKNIYPIYTVSGNDFQNVAEIYDSLIDNTGPYTYSDWFYLNDSIGIVKMKIDHSLDTINNIWELERWNVIK